MRSDRAVLHALLVPVPPVADLLSALQLAVGRTYDVRSPNLSGWTGRRSGLISFGNDDAVTVGLDRPTGLVDCLQGSWR